MRKTNITIDGYVCSEAEVAAIQEALNLHAHLGLGQLSQAGNLLLQSFLIRRDLTVYFRSCLKKACAMFGDAHKVLHDGADFKARLDPAKDAVPVSALRSQWLLCKMEGDRDGQAEIEYCVRVQAKMMRPKK